MTSRTLSTAVCVFLAALAVSCVAVDPVGGPINKIAWQELTGPPNDAHMSVRWYLDEIVGEVIKPGSGASTTLEATIVVRCWYRSERIHEHIPRDASWARVHRAYRLALDKNWNAVSHALGTTSGAGPDPMNPNDVFTTPMGWISYKPATVNTALSIHDIFTQIDTNTDPGSSGYSAAQHHGIVNEYNSCVPSTTASAGSAWVGFWEALEISRHPPSTINAGTVNEPRTAAIICEVCPD